MLSKNNIKLIHALRQNKYRKQQQLFIAEGPKVVNELLDNHFKLHLLFATDEFDISKITGQSLNNRIYQITHKELERISSLKTPNQVLAIFEIPAADNVPEDKIADLTLVLDDIRDPGNMGTIIRTADWFGINHIVCSENCVDIYNPKVVQSTMGSLARVKVHYTNLLDFIDQAGKGINVYGATMEGTSMYDLKLPQKAVLVIGSESHGISSALLQKIDHQISIPVRKNSSNKQAESLNAAIATAILCSEFRRQNK